MLSAFKDPKTFSTSLSIPEVFDRAEVELMPKGYSVESRTERMLVLTHRKGPDWALGCGLLLLGIVPGLIYIGLAGKTVRTSLVAKSTKSGTEIMWGTDDRILTETVSWFLKDLPD